MSDFPPGIAFIDGDYRPISEAKISVLDWGFLRSDATYDVVHVWQDHFFRLDAHLDRFIASVGKLRMNLPVSRERLAAILAECVRRSGLHNAYVEMILTRGYSPTFDRDPRDAENRLIVFAIPFGWIADAAQRGRGLHVALADTVNRIPPNAVDTTVKNYHWLDMVMGLFEAYDRGAENVILTDGAGHVTEGPGFNLFVVKRGGVATPATGVLEGITRQTVLDLCGELEITAEIRSVRIEELAWADEVFLSSTAGGVIAITMINDHPIAGGAPGLLTGRLSDAYWAKHADPGWTTAVADL